jgi:hypothetical protein
MNQASLGLDTREFQQAMKEYVAVTKKDAAYALNRQARNLAITSAMQVKKSYSSEIKAIARETWWPKVVAAIMRKRAGSTAAREIYQAQWAANEKAKRVAQYGKGQKRFKLDKKETSYAKEAKRIGSEILGSRVKAIGFSKWFVMRAARELTKYAYKGMPSGKVFEDIKGGAVGATEKSLMVKFWSAYDFKRRSGKSASSLVSQLTQAMNYAVPIVIKDMKKYAQEQLAKRNQQYSGKRA